MAEKKTDEQDHSTPEWLKTIQLNSWEAELVISALLLFALFQIPDFLESYHLRNFEKGSQFHFFFRLVIKSVELLRLGYILHILVRGLWVASVGLSYVFPKGIDKNRLKFKGRFEKELDHENSLVNSVLRLEELSSIIYGISFLAFGILLGVGMLFFTFALLVEGMVDSLQTDSGMATFYIFSFFLYFMLILLLFIDFITNGLFRRIEWVAIWFYPIALVFRVITLSFLFRRSLLVLISNTKGWKSYLIPVIVLVVCVSFLYSREEISVGNQIKYLNATKSENILNDNYENLRDDNDPLVATIQSDIIENNTLRLFLRDIEIYDSFYRGDSADFETKWDYQSSDSSSLFLNKWLSVRVDTINYQSIRWFKSQHRKTLNFGYLCYLDLGNISRGSHKLSISIDITQLDEISKDRIANGMYHQLDLSNIQFYYDKQ